MTFFDSRVTIFGPRRLAKPCISHQEPAGCCRLSPSFLLGYALAMAVGAFHSVDVMRAFQRLECRVHLFHIQTAIRELRMTRRARCASLLAVLLVTCQATQPFVNAHWRTIVAGLNLRRCRGRMTLVTERLPLIGTDLHQPRP